jgi:3-oxoacyl-[acyl-carrier protein] reductase
MNLGLTGKKAFVCGSTQGIGKAAAMELAKLGATVVLLARNEDALRTTVAELDTPQNQQHDFICADFSKPDVLKVRVSSYLRINKSPIQILVNNTGGPPAGKAIDANTQEFVVAFQNHLLCNQILVQALVEGMKSEKYGRIINVISTSVKQPIAGLGVSNTIRGAVASWAKTLAGELGEFGITVNNILPGFTDTARLRSLIEGKAKQFGKSVEEMENEMKRDIPLRRFAEVSEVANAIAFLASPAASYVNGINLPVDGGRTGSL